MNLQIIKKDKQNANKKKVKRQCSMFQELKGDKKLQCSCQYRGAGCHNDTTMPPLQYILHHEQCCTAVIIFFYALYHHKLPCHKYQRATHTNQGLQGSLAFILSFRAMAATCGCLGGHWAGFQPLPPPSFCSISTQLITRSISDCGQHQLLCFCPSTVTDNLLSNPVSSASSRNFMNQLPALACICFASFSEEPKADCAVVVLAGEGAEEDDVFSLLSPPPAILSNLDTAPEPMRLCCSISILRFISSRTASASSGSSLLATACIASMSVMACTAACSKLRKLSKQAHGVAEPPN